VKFDLVPSFKVCGQGNTTHGPPLALGSCNPAQPTSSYATVPNDDSSVANGFVRYVLRCTNGSLVVPDCEEAGDQEDVFVRARFQDVRQAADPTQDYGGELLATIAVRITDRLNGYGGGSGTASDASIAVTMPCTTSPGDATIGSTCEVNTTLDTVAPGIVRENGRAVWQVERMKVLDGGADGDAETAGDNTRFAVQGIAVP
jgi:hypothetical protein